MKHVTIKEALPQGPLCRVLNCAFVSSIQYDSHSHLQKFSQFGIVELGCHDSPSEVGPQKQRSLAKTMTSDPCRDVATEGWPGPSLGIFYDLRFEFEV